MFHYLILIIIIKRKEIIWWLNFLEEKWFVGLDVGQI